MTKRTGPYAGSDLANFVAKRIKELQAVKTQREIAKAAGFPNPNMLTMIKQGDSKLAIDRVVTLAKALDVDAKHLLRLALAQDGSQTTMRVIDDVLGTVVSHNEVGWLEELREASGNSDPVITSRARAALRALFGK